MMKKLIMSFVALAVLAAPLAVRSTPSKAEDVVIIKKKHHHHDHHWRDDDRRDHDRW
jgi:Ni/Co efflux regulator RcnB